MKNMKKNASLLMAIMMVFGCLVINSSAADSFSDVGSIGEKIATDPGFYDLAKTVSGQSNLLAYYLTDEAKDGKKYPDYYGGMYVEEGKLIVNVTELNLEVEEFIKNSTRSEETEIRLVDMSFNELLELMDFILDECFNKYAGYHKKRGDAKLISNNKELSEIVSSISLVYILEEENKIMVSINEINNEKINAFKKYISSSDKIQFQELGFLSSEPLVTKSDMSNKLNDDFVLDSISFETLYSGQHIYTEFPNDEYTLVYTTHCSVGFRCKKLTSNGVLVSGFITSAHGMKAGFAVRSANYNLVGHIFNGDIIYGNGMNADAAFVTLERNFAEITDQTTSGVIINPNYFINMYAGEKVSKCGYLTGTTSGTIISWTGANTNKEGIRIVDIGIATCDAESGDSGGVVYSNVNNPSINNLVGISTARGTGLFVFSKAMNIFSGLNLRVY